ncbi:hypothetical protein D9758_019101 [Tetrapyrgos nigripes]|uniref:Integrase core domain-containing protein n=1 Tax=Tetrapyrgos nigripes TaxID=182062 RepID=A0A8H5C1Q0_9AGAR|nr:hypothetical protein D9758_019101 [Tetrapyrgos nigripes]
MATPTGNYAAAQSSVSWLRFELTHTAPLADRLEGLLQACLQPGHPLSSDDFLDHFRLGPHDINPVVDICFELLRAHITQESFSKTFEWLSQIGTSMYNSFNHFHALVNPSRFAPEGFCDYFVLAEDWTSTPLFDILPVWTGCTKQRIYSLWHMDGNEKLRLWGFYVYRCVDGYSRVILYLYCTNNKRAKTVAAAFLDAVECYSWPSRMRGDWGTENNEVERLMIAHWGERHNAYLWGRLTHNVRIERMWRDVWKDTLEMFHKVFFYLEEISLLDMNSTRQDNVFLELASHAH